MNTNRCVDALVGLQLGSEGKGAVMSRIAHKYKGAARVGAPNAGHSVEYSGNMYKMRSIPCAWLNKDCRLFIGAAGMINMSVLKHELESMPLPVAGRLMIDVNAAIVTHDDAENEVKAKMYEGIGSTTEGIGEAMSRRIMRRSGAAAYIAMNMTELVPFLGCVSKELNDMVDANQPIILEGTQGFGLSLNHGYYPFVTSRDVLASSLLSECGLAPHTAREVIGVMRTYPIRVHGNSGPMGAMELTWADVAKLSGYERLEERTTVTNRVRRVSMINWDMLQAAVRANRCTQIAVTFIDYISCEDAKKTQWSALTEKSKCFVKEVESRLQVPVTHISTGPNREDYIDLENTSKEGKNA